MSQEQFHQPEFDALFAKPEEKKQPKVPVKKVAETNPDDPFGLLAATPKKREHTGLLRPAGKAADLSKFKGSSSMGPDEEGGNGDRWTKRKDLN